jgi:hypothetical protein
MITRFYNYSITLTVIVTTLALFSCTLCYSLSLSATVILYISKSSATFQNCQPFVTYYHTIWTNHVVPRVFERQQFFPRLFFVLDATRPNTHVSMFIHDYKSLIRTATDNSFLLYTYVFEYT